MNVYAVVYISILGGVKGWSIWRDELVYGPLNWFIMSKKVIVAMRRWWKIILNLTWCGHFLSCLWWCDLLCNRTSASSSQIRPDRWCVDRVNHCVYLQIDWHVSVHSIGRQEDYRVVQWFVCEYSKNFSFFYLIEKMKR